jgi:membrane protein YdbS with pleckstrin-like domain
VIHWPGSLFKIEADMQETKSIVLKPCTRTLVFYYSFALLIIALFIIVTIIEIADPLETIHFDPYFGISGLIMGLLILAIVIGIHLWMKSATYTITEHDARAHWGLILKFDDCIQLGAVSSIRVTQGPLQRAFNLGDITLYTTSLTTLVLRDINDAETMKEEIWGLVAKAKIQTGNC